MTQSDCRAYSNLFKHDLQEGDSEKRFGRTVSNDMRVFLNEVRNMLCKPTCIMCAPAQSVDAFGLGFGINESVMALLSRLTMRRNQKQ